MEHAAHLLKRASESGLADLNRKLGRSTRGATPDDAEQPFFKWRIKD